MRNLVTIVLAVLGFIVMAVPANAGCVRTEQSGCFELDLINFRYDPDNSLMRQMVGSGNVDGPIKANWGPRLYDQYKGGSAQSAGSKTFYVYTWNANCPVSTMSEYHIRGRNGASPTRRQVVEVSVNAGPSGYTEYDIGRPHQAFVVQTDKAVAAIQFPWDCIGSKSYILICTQDNVTIYPDRITGIKGIWLTPRQLASYRRQGWDYILLPHLSL